MDRRDFVKLSSGFLVAASVAETLPAEAVVRTRRIFELPASKTKRIAWTLDDGMDNNAIRAYLNFSSIHNLKFTHFVLSNSSNWVRNKSQMKDLIHRGLLQVGNHTRGHVDLRSLSTKGVKKQLMDCHHFIEDTFGVDARPFYRPPYGLYNAKVEGIARDLGYTTNTMWYGSLGDGGKVGKTGARRNAKKWITNGRILIGHTNSMVVPNLLPEFYGLAVKRGLHLVLLKDVFH